MRAQFKRDRVEVFRNAHPTIAAHSATPFQSIRTIIANRLMVLSALLLPAVLCTRSLNIPQTVSEAVFVNLLVKPHVVQHRLALQGVGVVPSASLVQMLVVPLITPHLVQPHVVLQGIGAVPFDRALDN
ncbi:unnamed protein product [Nippostrongylus brasiliensis]|uniref:Secreted protein n=1 Tax=Nippostrongylus brasiliensis TaxID=27835 RepID=A0A0N4YSL3_NIPBR|nr:hypothetical protein Q1695_006540 [Nippostrongylus brasiliensis]VDL83973.1 unnamed protein product [Nippostrongylus brasiliensis]